MAFYCVLHVIFTESNILLLYLYQIQILQHSHGMLAAHRLFAFHVSIQRLAIEEKGFSILKEEIYQEQELLFTP